MTERSSNGRRKSDFRRDVLLAVCAVALVVNALFMIRLDNKTDRYIEFGRYQSETERLSTAVQNLWNNEQTILAYAAAMRGDVRRLLDLETNEQAKVIMLGMVQREIALAQPTQTGGNR